MKNRFFGICVILCGMASANAALVVAEWQFATPQTPPANYAAAVTDSRVIGAGLSTSGGTIGATANGGVLQYNFGNGGVGGINNAVIELQITTAGATFSGFTASYTATSSKVTALTGTWSYSINGGPTTTLPAESITIGAGNTDALTGIALANNDVLNLRFTLTGAAADPGSSSLDFDNFNISATSITPVPEPANIALGLFGVLALGLTVGRRALAARKS